MRIQKKNGGIYDMKDAEKNVVLDEVFKQRIQQSNYFSKEDIQEINKSIALFKKCYALGILDSIYSNEN